MRYRLTVGAMFKNERHALVEWVEHYLHHGAEHIYLIDDGSTDGGAELLAPYVARGVVDLVRESPAMTVGRMQSMYDKHVLPHVEETDWLLICDLDEFIWSPGAVDLSQTLAGFIGAPAVMLKQTLFGSNGHVDYPPRGIVASYTRRDSCSPTQRELTKYFVNCQKADVKGLFIHWPVLGSGQQPVNGDGPFVFNHYACQCVEWWRTVKGQRGIPGGPRHAGDDGKRPMAEFSAFDLNDVEDCRLRDQNREIIARLYGV